MDKEKTIQFRVDWMQYDSIRAQSRKCSMTMSDYVRHKVIDNDCWDKKHELHEAIIDMSDSLNSACEILEEDYPELSMGLKKGAITLCHLLNA